MSDALRVSDLHRRYETPRGPLAVLAGLSLQGEPGEAVAILGKSGSGKSTLVNILATLDRPSSGQVHLGGVDPFALSSAELARFRRRRVGVVFQDHHLLDSCTARENVLLAPLAGGRVSREDCRRADALLERAGLADRADHLPAELSGGERQRVALARALMNRPALLLADEPTGNLDESSAAAVAELLLELARQDNALLLAVTHAPDLAARMDRRLRLVEGRLEDAE